MMASRAADVAAVQAGHDDRLVPGFEAELRRELRRAGAAGPGAGVQLPAGRHTFQRFEAWQRPGLSPPPGEALKLLHRCGGWGASWVGQQAPAACCDVWREQALSCLLQRPLQPAAAPSSQACRLAADPGIVGVMRQHRWTVGLLRCGAALALHARAARQPQELDLHRSHSPTRPPACPQRDASRGQGGRQPGLHPG